MRKVLVAVAIALLASFALAAQTQANATPVSGPDSAAYNHEMNIRAYIELLRADVKASRSRVMGAVMRLDTDEAGKFWPVFKDFETEYSALGDRIINLVRNYVDHYDELSDPVADQIANEMLSIEQRRNELKKKYYDRMKDALGAITATRFLQIENQLERLMDLQVASQLPVVNEQ